MATADGPRLIEINARFHAQHFQPIVSECIGYDAMTATLDSYFKPGLFHCRNFI
jgi:biotin carboxylase